MPDTLDIHAIASRVAQHDEAIEALKHARDKLEEDGRETRKLIADLSQKIDASNVAFATRLDTFRTDQQQDNALTRDKLDEIRMDQAKALERSANAVPTPITWLLRILLGITGALIGVVTTLAILHR